MKTIYPTFTKVLNSGEVSIDDVARILNADRKTVMQKLQGISEFTINEAMTINRRLLPNVAFEELFKIQEQ
ncbi:MAG: hypothetical protein Q4A46_07315 [Clostridia bacterium]|nr:hypothetical protein [Clostridia bacterium]